MGGLLSSPIVLGASLLAVVVLYLALSGSSASSPGNKQQKKDGQEPASFLMYCRFVYANFIKPLHTPSSAGATSGQQQALENFYQTQVLPYHHHQRPHHGSTRAGDGDETYQRLVLTLCEQASVYDATRRRLLRGREDMLGLLAAQVSLKMASKDHKPIWVDVRLFPSNLSILMLTLRRLAVELGASKVPKGSKSLYSAYVNIGITSRRWQRFWMSNGTLSMSTSSTCRRRCVRSPGSVSPGSDGRTSPSSARMRGSFAFRVRMRRPISSP